MRMYRRSVRVMLVAMIAIAMQVGMMTVDVFAGDAPATQYVARHWENGQVVSETKTQNDVAWMTSGHLEWHNNWWYTRDLDELVISDRVSVDNDATANLILMDGKTIKFENGIHVGKGSTLNIYEQAQGTGKLIVGKSKADTAAIGGNAGESNGTINIYGGTIQVTGGSHSSNGGAGIGAGGTASNESSINIYGGTITSTGGANAAGIGGGANGGHGGAINIYGGNVTANGDSGAAGIGGGEGGSGTGTFIHGGEVHANGGSVSSDGGAGIGSGSKAGREGVVAGNVYVYGGKVYAIGGADAAGIGGGNEVNGGNVEVNGVNVGGAYVEASSKTLGAGIGGGQSGGGGTFTIHKGTVKATGGSEGAGIGGGEEGGGVNFTIDGGKVEATGGSYAAGIGTGDVDNGGKDGGTIRISGGEVTAQAGTDAAGIGGGEGASGADVEIRGGTVNASGLSEWGDGGAGIGSGDRDGNDVNAGTIKIYDGIVTATGGADGAGIGGGDHVSGGTIEISGGRVKASTPEDRERSAAAGIGGGDGADGGTIRISAGHVEASGGAAGAGIGGGDNSDGGDIVISGGTVIATGHGGGAGIGGGDDGNGGTIKITDGNVTATGSNRGAGIGGGGQGDCGTIEISRGTINATGGEYAPVVNKPSEKEGGPGIGNGGKNSGDTTQKITISGGNITARGNAGGAGIGSGYRGNSDNTSITISDCEKLIASSGIEGAGIGGGDGANGGNITITGGKSITANGGGAAAGIGGGFGGDGGQITISGGDIRTSGGTNKDYAGAGIGGGSNGRSGKITIDGGTIETNGGNDGGAGIGSGGLCEKDNTVDVTINGGTIVAKGGDGLVYEDAAGHWTYYPGAAIGAGGYGYKNNHSDEKSYFNGNIYLNDGSITLKPCGVNRYSQGDKWFEFDENHSNYNNLIGTTNDKGLDDVTGNVFFNGAIVIMNNGKGRDGSYAQPVRASNVYISDEHVRQSVSYKVNENDDLTTVNKDARISTLSLTGNNQVVVGHCQHENSTYVDNGSNHSLTCNSCGVTGTLSHEYGNPVWTWAEDNSTASATFTCACGHELEDTATVTSEKTDEGTKKVYTAKVTLGDKEYTDTKTVDLPGPSVTKLPTYKDLTYTGDEQPLGTAGEVTGGTFKYALGGTTAPEDTEYEETVPKAKNAGTYYVWCKVFGDDDHRDSAAQSGTVKILKKTVSDPTIPDEHYTGSNIKADVPESPLYTVTKNEGGTDVGEYDVELELKDPDNYKWIDSDDATHTLKFRIVEDNTNIVTVSIKGWTYGEDENAPSVEADHGEDNVVFTYAKSEDGPWSEKSEGLLDAGIWWVKASIPAVEGGYPAGEDTARFEISKAAPTVLPPTAKPLTYTGEAQPLANAGFVTGGTMQYAVTTDTTEPAPDDYEAGAVPTKTDTGIYYLWYKVVGDLNHSDYEPNFITTKINADKKDLQTAITEAKDYYDQIKNNEDYQDAAQKLSSAISEAEEIAADSNASQQSVNEAKEAVKNAVDKAKEDVQKADAVKDQINQLHEAEVVSVDDKEAIEGARAAYDALTDDQKALIPGETLNKLKDAEKALAAAEKEAEEKKTAKEALEEAEKAADAAKKAVEEAEAAAKAAEEAAKKAEESKKAAEEAAKTPGDAAVAAANKAQKDAEDAAKAADEAAKKAEAAKVASDSAVNKAAKANELAKTEADKEKAAKAVESAAASQKAADTLKESTESSKKAANDAAKKAAEATEAAKKARDDSAKKKAEEEAAKKKAEDEATKDAEETAKDPDSKTPSDENLKKAKVDKKLAIKATGISTTAKTAKKQMIVKWKKVKTATNYRIAYRKAGAKNWTEAWTGSKNKYTLKGLKKNGLYEFKLMAVKKTSSTWTKSSWSKVNYRFYAKVKQKVKAGKKSVIVKVKKLKKASGYEVLTGLKNKAAKMKVKAFKGAKKTKLKVKGLKKGKKYFVRSRPYKTYKGHRYIGILNGASGCAF